jgi:hypothetical protein
MQELDPPTNPIHITTSPRQKTQQFTPRDRDIAKELHALQAGCRKIPSTDYQIVKMRDGKQVSLYRPVLEIVRLNNISYYGYSSIAEGDGQILLDAVTYAKYENEWVRRHMPFVSDTEKAKYITLLEEYSFFSGKCAYPSCVENMKGEFNPGLPKKAELLMRKAYFPPAYAAGGSFKVMNLKSMCYLHWLLEEMRPQITEHWMLLTVQVQGMPPEDRHTKRIAEFTSLIGSIRILVEDKTRANGERKASFDEIAEMLMAFIKEMTGSR